MLTPRQTDRLGPVARAIVDADRSLKAERDRLVEKNVVRFRDLAELRDYRDLIKDRRSLTTRADELWGKPLRGDGAAGA